MADQIQVSATRGVGNAEQATDLQPGTLTGYASGEWLFVGNGKTTPSQVTSRILDIEAAGDPGLRHFADSPEAAWFVATHSLRSRNRHLRDQGADEPIDLGRHFIVDGGATLKQLLAPFKDKIPELRQALARMGTTTGVIGPDGQRDPGKYTGGVKPPGRPLL